MARWTAACAVAVSFAVAMARAEPVSMAQIAHDSVRLVLAMGQHDADYVDAYYGPAGLKAEAEGSTLTLDALGKAVAGVRDSLAAVPADGDELSRLRHQYLD